MTGGPILFTPRLMLRPLDGSDLEPWCAFVADPEQMQFLGGTKDRSAAWRSLCEMAGAWSVRGFSMFSVIERATGQWVGRIGPWAPDGWPGLEVGWGVARGFAGKGYAYEGTAAAMDYVVDVLGWDRVIHTIAPENSRSIRLAQRLGSTNGGPIRLPPPFQDLRNDGWGQSAAQWRARRATTTA
jgi:RimJ/RimL family protein N-acetyltransferase